MKLATCLVTALVLLCSTAVFAEVTTTNKVNVDDIEALKESAVYGIPDPIPNQGGEDIANAVSIPALPYTDVGTTCGYTNDYDEACPWSGSAPDVVYSYTPTADTALDISLCNSGYDTKLYVYANDEFTPVACNDDTPGCGSDGFRSELLGVEVNLGNTYYIVVDGYGSTSCGDYDLSVDEGELCIVECPPGGLVEGEVDCFDDYKDAYNGGCNSDPNVFTPIPCNQSGSVTMCGSYGGFFHSPSGFNYRDTDWYELESDFSPGATISVEGEYETLFGYINAGLGCAAPVFEEFVVTSACVPASLGLPVGPMAVWVFAATSGFGGTDFPCPGYYNVTVTDYVCDVVSVEEASWGSIKDKYSQR